mgnify:CR=1 FL=1
MSRNHEKRAFINTSVSDKNQSSSQTKGFMHGLVQKILGTCERVANKFLHPGANYTYMYNIHPVCKSAHVNGAYDASNLTANTGELNLSEPNIEFLFCPCS